MDYGPPYPLFSSPTRLAALGTTRYPDHYRKRVTNALLQYFQKQVPVRKRQHVGLCVPVRAVANIGTSSAIMMTSAGQTDIQHIDLFLSPHIMFHCSAEAWMLLWLLEIGHHGSIFLQAMTEMAAFCARVSGTNTSITTKVAEDNITGALPPSGLVPLRDLLSCSD